jgi:1-acyl-sn-glycerol-3-phosphate acyltransferase
VERHPEVEELFGKQSALVCFTHASSLDAFILAAAVPVKHFSLVSGGPYQHHFSIVQFQY